MGTRVVAKITLNRNLTGATGGPGAIYCITPDSSLPASNYFSLTSTGSIINSIQIPSCPGYRFNGYYGSGGTQKIDPVGFINPTASTLTNTTWTADWFEYLERTLTIDPTGGTAEWTTMTVRKGVEIGTLPFPSRPGYTFTGWYDELEGGNRVTRTTLWWKDEDGTIYAHWTENPKHNLIFDANGGAVSPASIEILEGSTIGTLPDPTFAPNRFLGWFTASTGGTQVTASTTYSWSTDKTIYAHWEEPHTLTLDANGGDVIPSSLSVFTGDAIGPIPTPTLASHFFDGWYTEPDGGDPVDSSTTYTWTTDKTIYAHWTLDEQYLLQFNANGGTVSPSSKIVKPGIAVGELPEPTLAGHDFLGWYTEQTGGTQYTAATVYQLHADLVLFAHWSRYLYTIHFNPNGGEVSRTEKDVTRNQQIGELPTPTKYANTFLGWYTDPVGGEQWTASTTYQRTEDTTLYAHWETDPEYSRTLNFNANGGTVSPTSTTCTYGLAIGALPLPVHAGKKFIGWYSTSSASGGTKYTENSMCDWTGAKTIYARWVDSMFGQVEDFFNLGNSALVPIHSDSGDNKQRICVSHTGRYEPNVDAVSGVWRNPSVTYIVAAQTTLAVTLGKAFAAQYSGTGSSRKMTVSGYMITSVKVDTKMANAPTVTISAVSNEGADAVNATLPTALTTPFKFSVGISPRHRAQNLMSAISGGGELQSCSLEAKCDPVVVVENQMPCASDVVHPKITVSAAMSAYDNEGEPTATNGFTAIGTPAVHDHIGWKSYSFTAEKTM